VAAVLILAVVLIGAGAAGAYFLAQAWRAAAEQEDEYMWTTARRQAEEYVQSEEFVLALELIETFRAKATSDRFREEATAMRDAVAGAKKAAEARLLAEQEKRSEYGGMIDRARALLARRKYGEAIALLEEAAAILPEDPGAPRMIDEAKRARDTNH
jgi:predicted Zn-dependent protease